jgi:putative spermidine/putrescine transport system permease protein
MTRKTLPIPFLLMLPAIATLLLLFVGPQILLLRGSFLDKAGSLSLGSYQKFLFDPFYHEILLRTVLLSLVVTVISAVLGYPAAYLLARTRSRYRGLLMIATIFPFLVSALVRSYGWMVWLGNNGVLNQMLRALNLVDEPIKLMYDIKGVGIGLVHILLPYMILSLAGIIQTIDPALEDACHSLGADGWRTFRRVIFPLSLPGLIAGTVLVFSISMTAFVTPQLLGGPTVKVMSTMVYQNVQVTFDWPMGAALATVLLIVTMGIVVVSQRVAGRVMGGGA